jgi:hypothetical protein
MVRSSFVGHRDIAWLGAVVLAGAGCNVLLGIDEAVVSPVELAGAAGQVGATGGAAQAGIAGQAGGQAQAGGAGAAPLCLRLDGVRPLSDETASSHPTILQVADKLVHVWSEPNPNGSPGRRARLWAEEASGLAGQAGPIDVPLTPVAEDPAAVDLHSLSAVWTGQKLLFAVAYGQPALPGTWGLHLLDVSPNGEIFTTIGVSAGNTESATMHVDGDQLVLNRIAAGPQLFWNVITERRSVGAPSVVAEPAFVSNEAENAFGLGFASRVGASVFIWYVRDEMQQRNRYSRSLVSGGLGPIRQTTLGDKQATGGAIVSTPTGFLSAWKETEAIVTGSGVVRAQLLDEAGQEQGLPSTLGKGSSANVALAPLGDAGTLMVWGEGDGLMASLQAKDALPPAEQRPPTPLPSAGTPEQVALWPLGAGAAKVLWTTPMGVRTAKLVQASCL